MTLGEDAILPLLQILERLSIEAEKALVRDAKKWVPDFS